MGALALPEPARRRSSRPASPSRPRGWSSRRCGSPACSTTSATGRSPTSSTTTSWPRFPAPADPRRPAGKRADPRGPLAADHRARARAAASRGLRRAPGAVAGARRASPTARRSTRAGSRSSSRSRPSPTPAMPRWVRWLQPLLSGVFTVDNLDYVRRDAYLTGRRRSGRSTSSGCAATRSSSERGLTLYEPGLGALEMFLTARLFMYQQVYFHRTVRAIDLDLARGVRAVDPGDLRRRLAGRAAGRLRRPRRVRAAPPGRPLGARRGASPTAPSPGDGTVTRDGRRRLAGDPAAPADAGAPRPRSAPSTSPAAGRTRSIASARDRPEPGRVAIDLAEVDARPGRRDRDRLAARARGPRRRRRCRSPRRSARSRPTALIARRYRRVGG